MSAISLAAASLIVLGSGVPAFALQTQSLGARNCGTSNSGISSVTTGAVTHTLYQGPTGTSASWPANGTWKSRANTTSWHYTSANYVTAGTTIHVASTSCTFVLP